MTERRDEESGPAAEAAPDWVMQGPKPIELPPLDEAEEQKRRRGERSNAGGWLGLVLVLVAALIGTSPYWAPSLAALLPWSPSSDSDALAADISRLDERLGKLAHQESALEQRLTRLEDQARGAAAQETQQQQQRMTALKALTQRVAALEQRPSAAGGDPAEITSLRDNLRKLTTTESQTGERLAKLETRDGAGEAGRDDQALLLALGQLREPLQRSRPFAAELDTVEALGRDRPEVRQALQPLEAAASKGIPSTALLARRFEQEVAPAVLRSVQAPESKGWGGRILARLRSLVVVRRIDGSGEAGDPVAAAVAHAEAALGAGDLARAVAAVETLPHRAAAPAQAWLAEARQRLAAEQALAQLTDGITARLTGGDERSADR